MSALNSGVALPGSAATDSADYASGAIPNLAGYSDLAAIWDQFNGTSTTAGGAGAPGGWQSGEYWSATPGATGHASFDLSTGTPTVNSDGMLRYVVVQVL